MKYKETISKRYFEIISIGLLTVLLGVLVYFVNTKMDFMITSDDSSELLLAKLLASENGIISTNWYYSTELRVANFQIVAAILFKFLNDWHLVRIITNIVMYAVLIGIYGYFCKKLKIGKYFIITAAMLIIPFSWDYFKVILVVPYYIPHISITLATITLFYGYVNGESKRKAGIYAVSVSVLALIAGLGGMRQLTILYFPAFMASFIVAFYQTKSKASNKRYILISGVSCLMAVVGYVLNNEVLSKIFHFLKWENIEFVDFDFARLNEVLVGFFKSFGYKTGAFFSANILHNGISMLMVILTVVSIGYVLRNKEKVSESQYWFTWFVICNYVTFIMINTMTNMSYAGRYNIPIIVLSMPMIAIWVLNVGIKEIYKNTIAIALVLFLCLCGILRYKNISALGSSDEFCIIAEEIQARGYKNGYATYWNGNVLTELTDGNVEVWTWCDGTEGLKNVNSINDTFKWLQAVEHDTKVPSGKLFIILTKDELSVFKWKDKLDFSEVIYESDNYFVFGYPSYERLLNDTSR